MRNPNSENRDGSTRKKTQPLGGVKDEQTGSPKVRASQFRKVPLILRLLVILSGIVLGQAIIYGPALLGRKILLPLDLLATPGVYLPKPSAGDWMEPHDPVRSDLIYVEEISRRFAVAELHSGRWPLWAPYQFAGVPFVWPKYSPLLWLKFCTASPVILAWAQLLAAVVAGLGAYVFFRRVLGVGLWPAAVAAWCYPLTGFFIFWQGFILSPPVVWLPWLFLAVSQTVQSASIRAAAGLSLGTGLVLTSGALDVAGQVLLASGLFAVWGLLDAYWRQWFQKPARRAIGLLTLGWTLGFFLAAPQVLPMLEYAQTGARMMRRSAGEEDRPPVGLAALPQVVLPNLYGSTQRGSLPIFPQGQGNLLESSAATYAGVIATLFVAPLAWCSRRHRSLNLFWAGLGFFALSWCLNVPGLVTLLRLPGLNMMSHDRLVFAASFAILALTAVGLEVLGQGTVARRRWFWLPGVLLAGLAIWCLYRVVFPPEPLATGLWSAILQGKPIRWVRDIAGVEQVQAWFVRAYMVGGMLCGLGAVGWLILWSGKTWRPWAVPALGVILVGDLLWFAHDRSAQCDPALYYPRLPMLEELANATPGRIIGYDCLPATLPQTHGLRDVRGYDAVDPARLMALMAIAAETNSPTLSYALTQNLIPRVQFLPPDGIRLAPVLDMLGVRHVIFRGTPPPEMRPAFQGPDYWALVNHAALARAFVPQRVETVVDDRERLRLLASLQFNPRAVAYVEAPVNLPAACRGEAAIITELPTRVTMSVKMETPGLVVLADLWDQGWKAYLGGNPVPILRANQALRGVVVNAGVATLEFRYEPQSLAWGLRLAAVAGAVLLLGTGVNVWRRKRPRRRYEAGKQILA